MGENAVSQMAMWTAYARAYHHENDTPKIFNDSLAGHIFTKEERMLFDRDLVKKLQSMDPACAASFADQASALAWLMQGMAAPSLTYSRARYAEDTLEEMVGQGVRQYVILGAGMDTFAFRRRDLLNQLQVFEIDHPTTQAFKRKRITELGWEQPSSLHFIPVDFTKNSLAKALTDSSYDPKALSFFSWLGVTYYLPQQAVMTTLRAIATLGSKGSSVIFDYLDTDAFIREKGAPRVQMMLWSAQQEGEPMESGFDPLLISKDLASIGLYLYEDLSPLDIQRRYFWGRADYYRACENAHFARALVK